MKIDVSEILEAQKVLDKAIQDKHGVKYDTIFNELKLALFVELGELANEVRCFKFGSIKGPSERNVILEEYVDGIHFIGSISIAKGIDGIYEIPDKIPLLSKQHLTLTFNKLFSQMHNLDTESGIKNWYKEYLILGYNLGFTFNSIKKAYFEKNQINFSRQNNNY